VSKWRIEKTGVVSAPESALWNSYLDGLNGFRGGVTHRLELPESPELLDGFWCLYDRDTAIAFLALHDSTIVAIYVAPTFRRRGLATELITTVTNQFEQQLDGWSLPGDQATKSLYESLGWKARKLIMRAGLPDGELDA
jgi:GNAT superfamily N-acetyltransferase